MRHLKILNICLLLLSCITVKSQVSPFLSEDYPFVRKEFNEFETYGEGKKFRAFFQKTENVFLEEKGKVSIVHFGGSHIQADIWSDRMRSHLNSLAPSVSGSRGLIFPYTMARTNNPYAYNVEYTGKWEACRNASKDKECTLGVSGMAVTTKDTVTNITISFRESSPVSYAYNRLKIFHLQSDSSFSVFPANDSVFSTRINTAAGYTEFTFPEKKQKIELIITKTDSIQNHFTLFGILPENDEPGIVYHSVGVNGASVPSYNRCQLFPDQIGVLNPDLVVFSIGINDTHDPDFNAERYERNYEILIEKILASNPQAAFLFITNTDSYINKKVPNKNSMEARKAMIRLSEKYDGAVWDLFNVMGGLTSIKQWEQQGMAKRDLVHLTNQGYIVVGDLMFNAFLKSYTRFLSGKS
jgi:lysophospholipase L1-like esterase